jgi:hypothetical protein
VANNLQMVMAFVSMQARSVDNAARVTRCSARTSASPRSRRSTGASIRPTMSNSSPSTNTWRPWPATWARPGPPIARAR